MIAVQQMFQQLYACRSLRNNANQYRWVERYYDYYCAKGYLTQGQEDVLRRIFRAFCRPDSFDHLTIDEIADLIG